MRGLRKREYPKHGIYVRGLRHGEATLQHLKPANHGRYGTRKQIADDIRHYRLTGVFPMGKCHCF
jgi:hypothetical protein